MWGRLREREGQATVEAALTLPVVLIALLLVVQAGVVVRDAMALAQAAREGARAAAVGDDDGVVTEAVRRASTPLDAARIAITIDPPSGERTRGGPVSVHLQYVEHLAVPIVSRFVSLDLPLHSTVTMRLERTTPTPTPSPTPAATPSPIPTTSPVPTPTP